MQTQSFKMLPFLAMLYVTIIVAANVLIFRMTTLASIEVSAGAFLIPLWFMLSDIITEVYGYNICKRIIWYCMLCVMIFGSICSLSTFLPTPTDWGQIAAYDYVIAKQIRVATILLIGVICGGFINVYLVSKWKILLKGKYFWLRCIGASWIGQLIFSLVTITFNFYDKLTAHQLIAYLCIGYPQKMIVTILLLFPILILTALLQKIEGINNNDLRIKFNPFREE